MFVENAKEQEVLLLLSWFIIMNDKMLAYAFILTLVGIHEDHAGGTTSDLHCDDNLYVTQRSGASVQKGLVFVMNNRGDAWNGTWVKTQWNNTKFVPAAWCGRNDAGVPGEQWTQGDGWGEFFAPPRGYAVYVPQE